MAEVVSEGETHAVELPPKRRRIIDPSAIIPYPIYSNKVSSSLQLKPEASVFSENQSGDATDDSLWSQFSSRGNSAAVMILSDSEDEVTTATKDEEERPKLEAVCCPSPPPPESPVRKQSRRVKTKISEIDRKLRALSSLRSPEFQGRRPRRCRGLSSSPQNDDDIIVIMDSKSGSQELPYSSTVREIPLKIRCRTDIHKLPVLSTTPLSEVMTQLSVILKVPAPRLILLREAVELPTDSTVSGLSLGIADIIDCVVMAAEDEGSACDDSSSVITVQLQGKDRDSKQEFSVSREAALGSIFSQYVSRIPASAQREVRFQYDGSKVTHSQTPAQLDMEDGDIIEVWM